MLKKRMGIIFIALLVAINLVLWLVFLPADDGRPNFNNQVAAEILSTSALILMSCSLLLTTRPARLEPYFGGLDKMYKVHRTIGILVGVLLLSHFLVIAVLNQRFHLGISLGKIALIGLLLSIFLALAPRIPIIGRHIHIAYHRWRFTHRFIGIFFIIGILHSFRIENIMQLSSPIHLYVRMISFTGMAIYIYKELLERFFKKSYAYVIDQVSQLTGTVIELSLAPRANKLRYRSGQFLFIRLPTEPDLREPHPFTISSAPTAEQINLTIKVSGDFTQRLYDNIRVGAEARLEGPYGLFDYRAGAQEQVWIAGGIGLTPFLSWMRDFDAGLTRKIDFYYSLRSPDEALHRDEILAAQEAHAQFRAHVLYTNRDGRLSLEKISESSGSLAGKDFYLCGPFPMIMAFKRQLLEQGVSNRQIHYEEFTFR
jgi:predicted ferric reductase